MKRKLWLILLCAVTGLAIFNGCSGKKIFLVSETEPPSPAIEVEYVKAEALFNKGDKSSLKSAASILEKNYPKALNYDQKEKIAYLQAETYFRLQWYEYADSAYKEYLVHFTKTTHFDQVLGRRYEIAFMFITGKLKQKLFGLRILSGRGKGVDIARSLLKQYPYAPVSEENQLKLADYLYRQGDYEEAQTEYEGFMDVYPKSKSRHIALFKTAEIYLMHYKGPEYQPTELEKAEKFLKQYMEQYPQEELAPEVRKKLALVDTLKAEREFVIAKFYLKTNQPASAKIYMEDIVNNYPETKWAAEAKKMLLTIK
jgi:outer membrane protein assembly factor BamD (BamD/ComL family)